MATVAQYQARIDKLEDGIARGVTSIYVDGERVEYSSIKEMITAINFFRGQMALVRNGSRRQRPIRVVPTMNF